MNICCNCFIRYITLTHSCNTKWAENSKNELPDDDYYEENSNGLTTVLFIDKC